MSDEHEADVASRLLRCLRDLYGADNADPFEDDDLHIGVVFLDGAWVDVHVGNRVLELFARVAELEAALEVSVPLAELECIGGFDKTNPRYLYDEPEAWDVGVVPVYRRVAAPVTPESEE